METHDGRTLQEVLRQHKLWIEHKGLDHKGGGRRADFSGARFVSGLDLRGVNLSGACLDDVYFYRGHLKGANLRDASLNCAHLRYADLGQADLRDADLRGANLSHTNLHGARLEGTCLDPANKPNGSCEGFERDAEYIVGWRTARSTCVGFQEYKPGEQYEAPYFSTADTTCHPGLYLWPTRQAALDWGYVNNCLALVKVWAKPEETHHAGDKWRCKKFYRVEAG